MRVQQYCHVSLLGLLLAGPSLGWQLELVELDEEDKEEGLQKGFLDKNMEPFGAALVAYVEDDTPNYHLIKKLNKLGGNSSHGEDAELNELQLPMCLAKFWRDPGDERLEIVYRTPFASVWGMMEPPQSIMDGEPAVFPAKKGANWKEKDVKAWMLKYGYPTINVRLMDKSSGDFPIAKYLGNNANPGGSVLIFANLSGQNEIYAQFRIMRLLRPYAEKLKDKLKFTFVDRVKATRDLRNHFSVGVDLRLEAEILLIEDLNYNANQDAQAVNFLHGHRKKWRLQDPDETTVAEFFDKWEQRTLPIYWVSREPWTWGKEPKPQSEAEILTAPVFENFVYEQDPGRGRMVAFFNMKEGDGCEVCPEARKIWDEVARAVRLKASLHKNVVIAAIDQSLNEHDEDKIPGRLAQPLLMWYPAGSPTKRRRERRRINSVGSSITVDKVVKELEDLILDQEMEEEEEEVKPKTKKRRAAKKKSEL